MAKNPFEEKEIKKILDAKITEKYNIIIEYPYVDKDYRDIYYHHFAKKAIEYDRNVARVHLSLKNDSKKYLGNVIVSVFYNSSKPKFEIIKYNIEPCFLEGEWYACISEYNIHLRGETLKISRFPHIKQDTEFTRCAHAALWANLTYFSERYNVYQHRLPSEIVNTHNNYTHERTTPSDGVSAEDLCMLMKQFGFYPKIYRGQNKSKNDGKSPKHCNLFSTLDIYLDSGFPVLASITTKSRDKFHAINIIGHKKSDAINDNSQYTYNNNNTEYLVMDDTQSAYQTMSVDEPNQSIKYNDYTVLESIIVPLPERINLLAEHIIEIIKNLRNKKFNKNVAELYGVDHLIYRPFMMSAAGYMRAIKNNYFDADKKYFNQFFALGLPHFVWVIEITTKELSEKNKCCGHILLDATQSHSNKNVRQCFIATNLGSEFKIGIDLINENTFITNPESPPEFNLISENLKPIPFKEN